MKVSAGLAQRLVGRHGKLLLQLQNQCSLSQAISTSLIPIFRGYYRNIVCHVDLEPIFLLKFFNLAQVASLRNNQLLIRFVPRHNTLDIMFDHYVQTTPTWHLF